MRYRQLVSEPQAVLDRICAFLGIEPGMVNVAPPSNVKYWVPPTPSTGCFAGRSGAAPGSAATSRRSTGARWRSGCWRCCTGAAASGRG